MKLNTLSSVAGFATAMILSSCARADLLSFLSVVAVDSGGGPSPLPGCARTIYHVYANFTNGADRVLTWGIGGTTLGPGGIANVNAIGGPGSGFTNVGVPSAGTPSSPGTTRDWDTYATLGVRYLSQLPARAAAPVYSPGFPAFITGASLTVPAVGMATFISPDPVNAHGRADFINEGADTATRVLLMQLVVNQGEHVQGTIGVVWDGAGAPDGTVANGLTFSLPSFTPPCPADTNNSGAVDVDDLIAVILGWGPCTTCPASSCASDIDNDGDTDVDDLVAVILAWGDCP